MKHLAETLRSSFRPLLQMLKERTISPSSNAEEKAAEEVLEAKPSIEGQIQNQSLLEIVQRLRSNYQQHRAKTLNFKKASLFPDGKTNLAALSLVLRGVAEVLSQKKDLPWKADGSNLAYEKEVRGGKGKICYYVTDNPENPYPDLAEETARSVIDKFDPRAGAIHLIYCAEVANLKHPWEDEFTIDDKQLLDYTGLIKRRDLCKHEQLSILYHLLRQPAQVLAHVTWPKYGKVGAFTVADLQVWDITILRDFATDKDGNKKLIGLKVIGKPGAWTKYFLNQAEYYRHTGIITKKTVQKLFSIGKQNAGAARLLIWLTFQIKPGFQNCLIGKTLMEIAYGPDRVATAQHDRQLRRQLADDFATDLEAIAEAGWQPEIETGPAWLTANNGTKRPIGFWDHLLSAKWRFQPPPEAQGRLTFPDEESDQERAIAQKQRYYQCPSGTVIREARKAKGWSRAFFAATMGKSISWVDAVETGHRQVSQKDLPKLSEKLGIRSNSVVS